MTPPLRDRHTPAIDALFARLDRRIVAQIWLWGLGTVAGLAVAWLAFAFLADWALHVPKIVRLLHAAVLVLIPCVGLWRFLARPLARRPDREGLAVLVERARGDLSGLVVSAVQLGAQPNGAPELVAKVVERAERTAGGLSLEGIVDPRAPRLRAGLGAAALLACAAWIQLNPSHASIFFQRLLGRDVPWPQRTHLSVSIPLSEDRARVAWSEELIEVLAPRGLDVPVVVRADGELPGEVLLHFDEGRAISLKPSGGGTFRTLLRSVQTDFEFRATGGDDEDGLPRVRVTVLEPPDVTALAVSVTPPPYAGLAAELVFDGDVEVLAGSHVEVVVRTEPEGVEGSVQLLPEERRVALEPRAFPRAEAEADGADGAAAAELAGLGFELDVVESLRYRFELSDARGLTNPDPGLFSIRVALDQRPEVHLVAPSRTEFDTTARGLVPLVAHVEDDFGLSSVAYEVRGLSSALSPGADAAGAAAASGAAPAEVALAFRELPAAAGELATGRRASFAADAGIEVASLGGGQPPAAGTQVEIVVAALDNRPAREPAAQSEPPAGLGRSSPLRVRVVTEEELLRRVQDRLVRARSQAGELEELNRKRAERTAELLASLESDDFGGIGETELLAALTGARRVQGDARSLARELAGVAETVLYARIDEKAGALLGALDQSQRAVTDRQFHGELWLELAAAWRDGRLGAPGFAGQLVGLVDLALLVSEVDAQAATEALDGALDARDLPLVHAALSAAAAAQASAQAHIEDLLERLAEWDNFQSILTLTRDILNRQKALEERTRHMAQDK